jgi:peptide/nickel transport system permease protein
MDYVEAARCAARKGSWIIFREILPNALSPLVAEFGLRFIFAVLFISTLSFLGLGVQPPLADWGGMVKENKDGSSTASPPPCCPPARSRRWRSASTWSPTGS